MDPQSLRYSPTHEWARLDGDTCTVGISQFAVDQLTDVVYIELPEVGDRVTAGQRFGTIESVKAVSDLYAPVSGEITAVNSKLVNDTSPIGQDPYGKGWMVKIKLSPGANLEGLLTPAKYQEQIASQDH